MQFDAFDYIEKIGEAMSIPTEFSMPQDVCPACKSDDICNEQASHDGILEVHCLNCGHEWSEPDPDLPVNGKFTQAQVRKQFLDGDKELPVIQAWLEMADRWLSNGDNDYQTDGFKGLNQRTVGEVLVDFHLADLLFDPLDNNSLNEFLAGPELLVKQIETVVREVSYCFNPRADIEKSVDILANSLAEKLTLAQVENMLDVMNTVVCKLKG